MHITEQNQTVLLMLGPTDMRKSIDGLCAMVKYFLDEEPVSNKLFVFCNRARDKIKILQWSTNGFWLHYKRLEKGRFNWPDPDDHSTSQLIDRRELNWLLDGLPLIQPKAHKTLKYIYF